MKITTLLFILIFFVNCNAFQFRKYQKDIQKSTLNWGKYERTYWVHLPPNVEKAKDLAILFVLHGGSGTAKGMSGFTYGRFNELADQNNFIVVYPQGVGRHWNDGRKSNKTKSWRENVDDVGFLVEIVNSLKKKYRIDSEKVFTSGISNGGFMSTRLLCDRSDVFKGGAVVTATISEDYFPNCKPKNNVGVLVMNGTDDPMVPYDGGEAQVLWSKRGKVISTDDYLEFWRKHNGCDSKKTIVDLPDKENDGTSVSKQTFNKCKKGGDVVLYKINGGGHTWAGGLEILSERLLGKTSRDINACDEIWEFFKSLN